MPRPPHPWPNEIELLLACARREMREPDLARARVAIAAGIDWDRQAAIARAHRLLPLLSRFLEAEGVGSPDVRAAIRERVGANARRSLRLTSELIKLVRTCAEHGMTAVPVKGPVLAQSVYGSLALRQMDDLDVLVAHDDVPRVVALLAADGYAHTDFNPVEIAPLIQRHGNHISLAKPAIGVTVELHHRLLLGRMRGGTMRWLSPRLGTTVLAGTRVPALADEDLFVYLCAHGAAHAWSRLEWLGAIAEMLRARRVRDWVRARACADDLGAWLRVRAAIMLARELFESDLAREADLGPASRRLAEANADVVSQLSANPECSPATSGERARYQRRTDPNLAWQMRRGWSQLTAAQLSDIRFWRLPRAVWPLYVVLRPLRLIARELGLLRSAGRPARPRHGP